jgi:hypothetical protein
MALAMVLLSASTLMAAQVTLAWDPNTPAPDGYRLYQRSAGSAYNYASPVWSGKETSCTVSQLAEGNQYYFVVRAYTGVDESGDSNEVAFQPTTVQPATYTISASDGANGTISPAGNSSVLSGADLTYTITANMGYHVTSVVVDNVSVGTVTRYTFSNVSANHTIAATFGSDSQPPVTVNDPPVADAGANQTVTAGARVTLNGAGSSDPEGSALSYRWAQTSGPAVQLSAANIQRPAFTAPSVAAGQSALLVFELTVTDNQALTGEDTCMVQVNPAAPTDSDGDGVSDAQDAFPNDPVETIDSDLDGLGNNADSDDDNDGMSDGWEIQYHLNPFSDDSTQDSDNDGLTNFQEYQAGNDPTQWDVYHAPVRPEILYPADGAGSVSSIPALKSSPFADSDVGDTHTQSEWLITNADSHEVVLQTIRTNQALTQLRVPRLILDGGTTYVCQVRYQDNHGLISEWSMPVSFTTHCSKNSFCDSTLNAGQTSLALTDFNANNIPDLEEPQAIRTLQTLDGQTVIGISAEEIHATMDGAVTIDPSVEEAEAGSIGLSAYDLFTYRIVLDEPGGEGLVKIHSTKAISGPAQWICYDPAGQWIECGAEVYPQENEPAFLRMVQDGGPQDADGAVNGVIIDVLGVKEAALDNGGDGSLEHSDEPDHPASAAGSSCFIESLIK